MFVKVTHEGNGMTAEVDGSPASLVATMFDKSIMTPNYGKRLSRVETLSRRLGAEVYYPMNGTDIGIYHDGWAYECQSLRQAERILRSLRK